MRRIKLLLTKKFWSWVSIFLLFVSCYILIFHTHHYNYENYRDSATVLGVFALVCLQAMWFEVLPRSKWNKAANVAILFLIIIPVGSLLYFLQGRYVDYCLKQHGLEVQAKVVELYKVRVKSGYMHHAKIEYEYDFQKWTQKFSNEKSIYRVGDSLMIICSEKDPEMFKVTSQKVQ